MADLHGLAARLVLLLVLIGAGWAVALALTRRDAGPMLYGELVWVVGTLLVTGLVGSLVALTVAPPSDSLHVLYGVLAVAALPGAALVARDRPATQRVPILAIALVILAILVVRLFQTGG